jgi:hypothetical protein
MTGHGKMRVFRHLPTFFHKLTKKAVLKLRFNQVFNAATPSVARFAARKNA